MPTLMKVSARTDDIRKHTTFGFEAEWETGADDLNAALYANSHTMTSHLHNWHCTCDYCDPWTGGTFYGQTDSSCAGEIISGVHAFEAIGRARHAEGVFDTLADTAYAVGATAGLSAGFHVHVDASHLVGMERSQTLAAFALWENALDKVASGAWPANRGYNRTTLDGEVGNAILRHLPLVLPDALIHGSRKEMLITLLEAMSPSQKGEFYDSITYYLGQGIGERHSALNPHTGHGTWEFRLWNSTRSPWRMELYTRLSIALMDPAITRWMVGQEAMRGDMAMDAGLSRLSNRLISSGHDEAGTLLKRQMTFRENKGW